MHFNLLSWASGVVQDGGIHGTDIEQYFYTVGLKGESIKTRDLVN